MRKRIDQNQVVAIRGTVYTGERFESAICKICLRKYAKRYIRQLESYAYHFKLVSVNDALTNETIDL